MLSVRQEHRLVVQALGPRRGIEHVNRDAARALTHDGDGVRVAAERRDVLLHPLQRRDLVQCAVINQQSAVRASYAIERGPTAMCRTRIVDPAKLPDARSM